MTDFRRVRAFTIQPTTSMQSANNEMIASGVRLLLVVDVRNRAVGRRHALVVETDGSGRQLVRGLFSATQVEKQLGTSIEPLAR